MDREFIELPMDAEVDKIYYLDYLSFAVPSRYICSLALYKASKEESIDLKKRTYAVGISHQRFMSMEDTIHLCTALSTLSKKQGETTFFQEMAKVNKHKDEKNTMESIRDKTFLPNIGLKKNPSNIKAYERLGLTKTVFRKQWDEFKRGHKKLLVLYDEFKKDYNKIKHGYSLISSTQIFTENESEWNQLVCTVVPSEDKSSCKLRSLTSIDSGVMESHIEDMRKTALNNSTLMYMYAIAHYRSDKPFIEKLNVKKDYILKILDNDN